MYKFKVGLTILAAAFTLAACGESFRAKELGVPSVGENGTNNNPIVNNPINGTTPLTVDQKFAANYVSNLSAANTSAMQQFIKAFVIKKSLATPNVDNVVFSVQIATGCNQSSLTTFSGMTGIENLLFRDPGTRINIGSSNGFEVHVQCTNVNCNEMVAAITHNSNGVRRTVLAGLIEDASYPGTTTKDRYMVSRGVNEANFLRFNNIVDYFIGCVDSTQPQPQDPEFNPFGSVDPTEGFGGEVQTGNNNNSGFDPFFTPETL